jgi:hypothetical protein
LLSLLFSQSYYYFYTSGLLFNIFVVIITAITIAIIIVVMMIISPSTWTGRRTGHEIRVAEGLFLARAAGAVRA